MNSTLITIAKDIKLQIRFNPASVQSFRLLGYENRRLQKEDFNDDTVDAGEIGAGHGVTALYEIVSPPGALPARESGHGSGTPPSLGLPGKELLTLEIRYKEPEGVRSRLLRFAAYDRGGRYQAASADFKFAAAVAGLGMLLRNSKYKGHTTFKLVRSLAKQGLETDEPGYRKEFARLVKKAEKLVKKRRPKVHEAGL